MYSMYFRHFWCIGNRYSVFYENYLISQFTVRKSFFAHFLLLLIKDESHSSASRQQKLASRRTEIWWEKSKLDALKSTIHTACAVNLTANSTQRKFIGTIFQRHGWGGVNSFPRLQRCIASLQPYKKKKSPQPFPFSLCLLNY